LAAFKLSLNEGSLLRRTVLHVGAFVLGTAAFLALASFLLMSIVNGLLSPSSKGDKGDKSVAAAADDADEESPSASTAKAESGRPSLRPPRKRRGASAVEAPKPAEEEE
jgi:hypothetical protein